MTATSPHTHHVSLVALPDGAVSTLFGIYDAMNAFAFVGLSNAGSLTQPPFRTHIVGETEGLPGAGERCSGGRAAVGRHGRGERHRDRTVGATWARWLEEGRYPRLVQWLQAMHDRARLFTLHWHQDGLTPYIIFEGRTDHGDAEIHRKRFRIPKFAGP